MLRFVVKLFTSLGLKSKKIPKIYVLSLKGVAMEKLIVNVGDIVVTNFVGYQHWSIVSRICPQGDPLLISATDRNGTVEEESWETVTQGKKTYVADVSKSYNVQKTLDNARSQIGKWNYSIATNNCEHFVKWSSGINVTSTQVVAGVGGAVVGALIINEICENPKLIQFLGGSIAIAGLAILLTRPKKKN
jgi:hypothetical protein